MRVAYAATAGGAVLRFSTADAALHAAAIAQLQGATLRLVVDDADRTATVVEVRSMPDGGAELLLGGGLDDSGGDLCVVDIVGTQRAPWWFV